MLEIIPKDEIQINNFGRLGGHLLAGFVNGIPFCFRGADQYPRLCDDSIEDVLIKDESENGFSIKRINPKIDIIWVFDPHK